MSAYSAKDAAKETDVPEREARRAWHTGRDDSGRDETEYGKTILRDPILKDNTAQELSRNFQNSGIPDIMSLPSGYESEYDQ